MRVRLHPKQLGAKSMLFSGVQNVIVDLDPNNQTKWVMRIWHTDHIYKDKPIEAVSLFTSDNYAGFTFLVEEDDTKEWYDEHVFIYIEEKKIN